MAIKTVFLLLATSLVLSFLFAGAEDSIFNGEKLLTNQYIENGPYRFIMQGDCNLVLYGKKDNAYKPMWASNTAGHGDSCNLLLQNNGNLVLFSESNVVWSSSSTRGPNNYRLVVQGDGNVVIYGGAIWASNTAQNSKTKVNVVNALV